MEEARLIELASQGDAGAFNSLMGMHERRMYAVALRMCGNAEDAQDCLQEAMLRVYRAISGFKGQSSFSTLAAPRLRSFCSASPRCSSTEVPRRRSRPGRASWTRRR